MVGASAPAHGRDCTKSRSKSPSRSKSSMPTPDPIVSGRSFFPAAPLTWTKSTASTRTSATPGSTRSFGCGLNAVAKSDVFGLLGGSFEHAANRIRIRRGLRGLPVDMSRLRLVVNCLVLEEVAPRALLRVLVELVLLEGQLRLRGLGVLAELPVDVEPPLVRLHVLGVDLERLQVRVERLLVPLQLVPDRAETPPRVAILGEDLERREVRLLGLVELLGPLEPEPPEVRPLRILRRDLIDLPEERFRLLRLRRDDPAPRLVAVA